MKFDTSYVEDHPVYVLDITLMINVCAIDVNKAYDISVVLHRRPQRSAIVIQIASVFTVKVSLTSSFLQPERLYSGLCARLRTYV